MNSFEKLRCNNSDYMSAPGKRRLTQGSEKRFFDKNPIRSWMTREQIFYDIDWYFNAIDNNLSVNVLNFWAAAFLGRLLCDCCRNIMFQMFLYHGFLSIWLRVCGLLFCNLTLVSICSPFFFAVYQVFIRNDKREH